MSAISPAREERQGIQRFRTMEDTPMISFRKITEDNFAAIIQMKRPDGERFVAANAYSLA